MKKYIEINKIFRKYIPIKTEERHFIVTPIAGDLYFIQENIDFGELSLHISFISNKSGEIFSHISNNYFIYVDTCPNMLQYNEYKKDLLLRIKLDMEEKRTKNMPETLLSAR